MSAPAVRERRSLAAPLGAAVVLAAAVAFVILVAGGGAPQEPIPGLPDPGRLTGWGLPALRLVSDGLAIAVVAGLLVAPLTMRRPENELGGTALRALLPVRWLAAGWCLVALVQVVLTYSDQFAVPVGDIRWRELRGFATGVDQPRALLAQAALLAVVAIAARWVLTARGVLVLLGLALVAVVPPILTGHASSAGNHDTAIVAMVVHVVTAVVWIAGVLALWWHLALATKVRDRALHRFSALAGWCLGLTTVSGVVSAWVRLERPADLLSAYGAGVLVKTAVIVVVGLIGLTLRRRVIAGEAPDWVVLLRLTGLELLVMAVAVGAGVGLSRTPPPAPENLYTSLAEGLLGGPLPPAPTFGRLLWSFTPSGLGFLVVGLGAAAYLAGIVALRRRGDHWSLGRTITWFAGLAVVGYATFGGLGTYSGVMFSAHMAAHMALSMVAPILLVSGRPLQLALRALPGSDVPGGTGPRQLLAAALDSRLAHLVLHPVTAALLLVGSLYVVYFSSLFDVLMRNHLGHLAMELHFLAAGLVFFEVLIGDRPGGGTSYVGRLMLLLVTMPFHAFFSISVMGSERIIGAEYFRLIDAPYVPSLLDDQHLAGAMNWALGEIPMVMVIVVLVIQWWRDDEREAKRRDRAADRDGDAELAAYNEMLKRASKG
ncbi:bifunctional copper resistance protein CopD/cytochrome c oxidase assembly protein [Pimelobacter simplex]|uniref:bifunctional copper resistance protein CopD/cytochrome c oxidase assembly protein n=1 Tax=Nocardioides simplex TaxID=2045 RepID=UPI0027E359E2|nr:bifunctional copper resistance protein CopD/cytochrome c oxidase assembly protein [Pimelobacter simplex]